MAVGNGKAVCVCHFLKRYSQSYVFYNDNHFEVTVIKYIPIIRCVFKDIIIEQ